jgi:hypothetical protein
MEKMSIQVVNKLGYPYRQGYQLYGTIMFDVLHLRFLYPHSYLFMNRHPQISQTIPDFSGDVIYQHQVPRELDTWNNRNLYDHAMVPYNKWMNAQRNEV